MYTIQELPAYIAIDLETRSNVDLTTQGAPAYFESATTGILTACAVVQRKGEPAQEFIFSCLQTLRELNAERERLSAAVLACPLIWWVAHNADGFESLAATARTPFVANPLSLFDGEGLAPESWQWIDTATLCRMHNIPASLAKAAAALGVGSGKMAEGKRLIKLLSIPRKDGTFNAPIDLPEDMALMAEYNAQDVVVMEDVARCLDLEISPEYVRDAEALRNLNAKGVPIDAEHVRACVRVVELKRATARASLAELTEGRVTSEGQNARLLEEFKMLGFASASSFDQNARDRMSADMEAGENSEANKKGLAILAAVNEVKSASLGKYAAIHGRSTHAGKRLCGNYLHAGAGQTGRYSSAGVQIHNLNRGSLSAPDFSALAAAILPTAQSEASSAHLAGGVRQTFCKPGHKWVIGDWTAVEARMLPWLADSAGGREKLGAHTDPARDVYREAAQGAGLDYDKNRTEGKIVELALGFGGGAGALESMAAGYGVDLATLGVSPPDLVRNWRRQNAWAVVFWDGLVSAARSAIRQPGERFTSGLVSYVYDPALLNRKGALIARLQCGSQLVYPRARLTNDGLGYSPARYGGHKEVSLWRGLLAENVTQSSAASLLREALATPVCQDVARLHTHDEIGLLVPAQLAEAYVPKLTRAMTTLVQPAFPGLPLAAEVHTAYRYQKAAW